MGVEAGPVPRSPAAATVDDQVVRVEGHLGVQVVLQHAVGSLDQPVLAGQFHALRGTDGAGRGGLLGGELGGARRNTAELETTGSVGGCSGPFVVASPAILAQNACMRKGRRGGVSGGAAKLRLFDLLRLIVLQLPSNDLS